MFRRAAAALVATVSTAASVSSARSEPAPAAAPGAGDVAVQCEITQHRPQCTVVSNSCGAQDIAAGRAAAAARQLALRRGDITAHTRRFDCDGRELVVSLSEVRAQRPVVGPGFGEAPALGVPAPPPFANRPPLQNGDSPPLVLTTPPPVVTVRRPPPPPRDYEFTGPVVVTQLPPASPAPLPPSPPAQPRPDRVWRPDWIRKPSYAQMVDSYPREAKDKGVAGYAVLLCQVTPTGTLSRCAVESETPAGRGFGDAALGLAPRFQMKSAQLDGAPTADKWIRVPFRWGIDDGPLPFPAVTNSLLLTEPRWEKLPTREEMERYYPAKALREGIQGRVTLICDLAADGRLDSCVVESETPVGAGFGNASLALSGLFRSQVPTVAGQPIKGARVRAPIRWETVVPELPVTGLGDRSWRVTGADKADYALALRSAALEAAKPAEGAGCPTAATSLVEGVPLTTAEAPAGVRTSAGAAGLFMSERIKVVGCGRQTIVALLAYRDERDQLRVEPYLTGDSLAGPATAAEVGRKIAAVLAANPARDCTAATPADLKVGEVILLNRTPDRWTERWPVRICGRPQWIDVRFKAARDGGRPSFTLDLNPALEPRS